MALKATFPIFSLISMVFLVSFLSTPKLAETSSFDFLEQIQGSHKGDHLEGIHHLKNYLHLFGYLFENDHSLLNHNLDNDDFDDDLESAIKTYQLNYHLNVTGTLNSQTVSTMVTPRCGVADIINGTTRMESGKIKLHHRRPIFHTASHYSFFPGNPKWRPSKYRLTYAFLPKTPRQAIDPVASALHTWAMHTHFSFKRVRNYRKADVKIGFYRGSHGDGESFDGRGGIIAHAFCPEDGRFHYDGDEKWSVRAMEGAYDLETVALHKIGHLLGLGHSSVEGAIMYPSVSLGSCKGLHFDDVQGIRALYNF